VIDLRGAASTLGRARFDASIHRLPVFKRQLTPSFSRLRENTKSGYQQPTRQLRLWLPTIRGMIPVNPIICTLALSKTILFRVA
jgi:hypothetical protein